MMEAYADAVRFLDVCEHVRDEAVVLHIEKQRDDAPHAEITYEEYNGRKTRTCTTVPICTLWFYVGNFASPYTSTHLDYFYQHYLTADLLIVEDSVKETLTYFLRETYRKKAMDMIERRFAFLIWALDRASESFPELPGSLIEEVARLSVLCTIEHTIREAQAKGLHR
jgi:hypothetical protein